MLAYLRASNESAALNALGKRSASSIAKENSQAVRVFTLLTDGKIGAETSALRVALVARFLENQRLSEI